MKKIIINFLLWITIIFSIFNWIVYANNSNYDNRVNSDNRTRENHITNDFLDDIKSENHIWKWTQWGVEWISDLMMNIAQSLKNIFIIIASIYFLIITLKLLFAEWSNDEEFNKFKNWTKWITAWIIVMQIAFSYVSMIYNKKIWADLSAWLIQNVIEPLIKLLETAASFFFIAVMVFAFYRIITSWWDDEKAKKWKNSIWFAILWFLVIKVSRFFVEAFYAKTLCNVEWVTSCVNERSLSDWAKIVFDIINWLNWFVWIVVVIMIIYAWAQIIFSSWDDEKIKKSKKSIIYIIIWITILIMNYLILTFFLVDDLTK
jgi:hypothetical protein